jgi:hypothetical protein
MIPSSVDDRFNEIYEKCKGEAEERTTTAAPVTESTTEEPEEGSGFELSQSYILV